MFQIGLDLFYLLVWLKEDRGDENDADEFCLNIFRLTIWRFQGSLFFIMYAGGWWGVFGDSERYWKPEFVWDFLFINGAIQFVKDLL
jgi:hypothetical protein